MPGNGEGIAEILQLSQVTASYAHTTADCSQS